MNFYRANIKILIFIAIVFGLSNVISAQTLKRDSALVLIDSAETQQFCNTAASQLDSLLNIWYIKQSVKANTNNYSSINDVGISYSDSIYAKRLAEIPSIIPLTYNKEVRGFIEMYCVRKRKLAGIIVGLTKYYFPMYEEIMEQNGVPHELKYLSIIESALNPNAVSCVGATGLWQFMFSTGRMYGLEVNTFVDARKDPVRATHAAARYLNDLHKIYNDWILAIAAYNCGPGNVNKAIRRAGGKTDFWEIYYFLPKETRGYVPAYIAATYMMNYYDKHNIIPIQITMPVLTDTVVVNKEVHLQQIAAVLNIPIEEMRSLNPQYKRDIVPAYKDSYSIILPPNKAIEFTSLRDSIHRYNYSTYFTPMRVVDIESQNSNPALNVAQLKKKYHLVRKGETLASISKTYGIAVGEIKYMNKIRGKYVAPGKQIVVGYTPIEKTLAVKKVDTATTPKATLLSADSSRAAITTPSDSLLMAKKPVFKGYHYYKVAAGDTIWSIAKKFPGITHIDILNNNKLKQGQIQAGQVLKIPKG